MLNDHLFFFEQTDFSLRFARCVISETSLQIEDLKEVSASDPATIPQLAPAGSQVVCALRPKPRCLHLATVDEAKRYPGLAGVQQFSQLPAFAKNEPSWFAAVQASDGAIPASSPWLMSLSSDAAQQQARTLIETIKLKPARCLDATLATIGAITSTVTAPTLLIEIGELNSQALLIGPNGVLAARSVTLNLDQIADAVQAELNLKFRGSAAKLFFNPDCDFTDSGPKIAARLGTALKADLAPLLAGQPAPTTLCCSGLPALQNWLEVQLASVLGIAAYAPDFKGWSAAVGMTFGNPALAASVSPAWFNFLHFINSQTLESPVAVAWQAEWLSVKAPIAPRPPTTPPVVPGAQRPANPTPVVATAAPASTAAPGKPAPSPAANTPTKSGATPAPAAKAVTNPTPVPAKPGAAPAKPSPSTPAKPVSAGATPAKPAAPAAAKPTPAAVGAAKSPASSVQYSAKPATSASSTSTPQNRASSKSKMPLFIGIGALVLILAGAGGYFYVQSQNEEAARIAQKQKDDERVKAEAERTHLAEKKAKEEEENRKKFELESSRKLAVAENARKQAEEEARNEAANRLANARGTLIVTTQPAGATVKVGDLPPRPSPATFNFVKIGKYPVTITLAHHEDAKLELEVTENNTTDSGVITLASVVGAVTLTSDPSGSNYELKPANSFLVAADAKRTGQTPATIDNLDPGDYSITYSRPGWAPHTETVSVTRNNTSKSSWAFPSGLVKITSLPSGATVTQNGNSLGVTPLTTRQPLGAARYELKLAFHDPVFLSGSVEDGKTLELNAQLPLTDIIFGPSELDKNPEPINPKTPDLPPSLTLVEGKVVIQMTINRDGSTSDLKIIRASNAEIGKIYLAALAKWKFKPGTKDGKPVRSSVVVPFLINPS
ncbi:MAG TPA: PEGA domain-containing protein [Lacunisphaera sp.]|jgi:TonB family protein